MAWQHAHIQNRQASDLVSMLKRVAALSRDLEKSINCCFHSQKSMKSNIYLIYLTQGL